MAMTAKELKAQKRNIQLDLDKMQREYEKLKTNHVLHAIISIFSIGLWLLVWIIIGVSNSNKRSKFEKMIDESKHALMEIEDSIDDLQNI